VCAYSGCVCARAAFWGERMCIYREGEKASFVRHFRVRECVENVYI